MTKTFVKFVRGVSIFMGALMCISIILSPFGILVLQNATLSMQLETIETWLDKGHEDIK